MPARWLRCLIVGVMLTLAAAAKASPACPVANGGRGEGLSVRDALETLRACFPGAPSLEFHGPGRPGDPEAYVADIREARDWGWRPAAETREGIRAYAAWHREGAP